MGLEDKVESKVKETLTGFGHALDGWRSELMEEIKEAMAVERHTDTFLGYVARQDRSWTYVLSFAVLCACIGALIQARLC